MKVGVANNFAQIAPPLLKSCDRPLEWWLNSNIVAHFSENPAVMSLSSLWRIDGNPTSGAG